MQSPHDRFSPNVIRSPRVQQDDRDVARGVRLVGVVVWPLRGHGRPHALLVRGRSGAGGDGDDLVPHLDLHVRVREQVLVPARVLGAPPFEATIT